LQSQWVLAGQLSALGFGGFASSAFADRKASNRGPSRPNTVGRSDRPLASSDSRVSSDCSPRKGQQQPLRRPKSADMGKALSLDGPEAGRHRGLGSAAPLEPASSRKPQAVPPIKLAEPSQGCGATASTRRASSACSSSSRGRAAARSPPPPPDPRSEHGSGGGGASSRRSARPEALAEEEKQQPARASMARLNLSPLASAAPPSGQPAAARLSAVSSRSRAQTVATARRLPSNLPPLVPASARKTTSKLVTSLSAPSLQFKGLQLLSKQAVEPDLSVAGSGISPQNRRRPPTPLVSRLDAQPTSQVETPPFASCRRGAPSGFCLHPNENLVSDLTKEDCVPEPDDETLEFLSTSCDTDSSDNSGCDAACAVLEAHLERTPAPADGSAAVWAERSAVARALELAAPLREQEQTLKEVGDEAAVSTEQRRPSKLQPLELPLHQSARAAVAAAAVAQQMGSSRVEERTLKDAGANFGSRSSVKLQLLDAPPHESARGCSIPGIVQGRGGAFDVSTLGVASTRLAHLRHICLDGLGHQKFQVAKQCWESLCAPGEVRPTSGARERMLEVLGEEYIAFCTLIEQIVHMESEWAHAPADLHRC